jgi:hypothetical protein
MIVYKYQYTLNGLRNIRHFVFARSLVFFVVFVDRCFALCTLSFGYCVVCPSDYLFGVFKPFLVSCVGEIPPC